MEKYMVSIETPVDTSATTFALVPDFLIMFPDKSALFTKVLCGTITTHALLPTKQFIQN